MAEVCTVCADERKDAIDADLLTVSDRVAALKFGLSRAAVGRHRRNHLKGEVLFLNAARAEVKTRMGAVDGKRAAQLLATRMPATTGALETPEDVLSEARDLFRATKELVANADRTGDSHGALRALREARAVLELFGRAYHMFEDGGLKIDQSTKIVNVLGGLSDDEMRAFIATVAASA